MIDETGVPIPPEGGTGEVPDPMQQGLGPGDRDDWMIPEPEED
jgi:hypothetical protein